ncbi:hypothetical protein L596_016265 [Steinernema carpocapsae]|uniref:Uncharacterized protein n=1 Tax=Steinernema carpocapsae TaxID=34508 RepID=A0A4U5NI87_STECR|nr:hypothetical protein L596_016265 [Steinernema carpocapsae]
MRSSAFNGYPRLFASTTKAWCAFSQLKRLQERQRGLPFPGIVFVNSNHRFPPWILLHGQVACSGEGRPSVARCLRNETVVEENSLRTATLKRDGVGRENVEDFPFSVLQK